MDGNRARRILLMIPGQDSSQYQPLLQIRIRGAACDVDSRTSASAELRPGARPRPVAAGHRTAAGTLGRTGTGSHNRRGKPLPPRPAPRRALAVGPTEAAGV